MTTGAAEESWEGTALTPSAPSSASRDDRSLPPGGPVLDELLVPLEDEGGEALATAVRALPHTPWLTVLDAYVDHGRVVVVLPATDRSLGEALDQGLDRDTAQVLLWSFDESIDLLDDQGLAPATLDPDAVGLTPTGDVLLLPVAGPASSDVQLDAAVLVARLQSADGAPGPPRTSTAWPSPADRVVPAEAVQDSAPAPVGPSPLDDLLVSEQPESAGRPPLRRTQPAVTGDSGVHARSWGRTVLLAAAAGAVVLAIGLAVEELATPDAPRAASQPAQYGEQEADGPDDLDSLVLVLAEDPSLGGEQGAALLRQLEQVQSLEGPRRAAAAAAALETVATSPSAAPDDVRRIREVVRPIAQPADLVGLVALLQVDPTGQGSAGPEVLSRLVELQGLPASELARTRAQDLAAFVASRAILGQVTGTFAEIAQDVLQPLAQPADLTALLQAVRVQPERFGPGTPALVDRLELLAGLQGGAAQTEAAALLAAIDSQVAGGTVIKAFQDIAAPVLRPLATPPGETT